MFVSLPLLAVFGHVAVSQFVTPPTDLITKTGHAGINVRYKEVPAGVCEQNASVKSYSGYADVSENEHIFWWFFEARNVDPTTAPLTIWINGGPGSSSMIGLFQELGPCTVNASGVAVDNPFSWSNASNMIFIDQPTMTGNSYSIPVPGYLDPDSGDIITLPNNTCPDYASDWSCGTYSLPDVTLTANSTPGAAPNFYKTLQGFTGAFPQYSQHDLYFTTESYGGHYGPIFTQYFQEQNALAVNGTVPINVKGLLIGNGWFDPLLQYEGYYNFSVYPGNTYDIEFFNESQAQRVYNNMYGAGNCYDQIVACNLDPTPTKCSTADTFCFNNVENIEDLIANRDEYDTRELMPDLFPPTFYVDYLNSPDVQAALGLYVNFSESSPTVGAAFGTTGDDAISFSIPDVLGSLIDSNVSVVLYFGDADYNCNWLGGGAVVDIIDPQPPNFASAGWVNITGVGPSLGTPLNGLIGEVRQSSTPGGRNFAFVRIFESGHEVPFYQPAGALAMLERVIAGLDIASGTQKVGNGYLTSGPMVSAYREGNGTVQTDVLEGDDYVYDVGTGMPVNGTVSVVKRGVPLESVTATMRRERRRVGRRNLHWGRR